MLSILNEVYSLQPKYYGGDYNRMLEILLECKSTGTTFLVGGRKIEGVFKVWIHLDIFFTHIWREKKRSFDTVYTCYLFEGPWGFRHSKRAERHVHLHTRGKVSHGYFIYWNKEEARALIYQIWSYYYSTAGSRWFSTTIEGTYECLQIIRANFSSSRTPRVC